MALSDRSTMARANSASARESSGTSTNTIGKSSPARRAVLGAAARARRDAEQHRAVDDRRLGELLLHPIEQPREVGGGRRSGRELAGADARETQLVKRPRERPGKSRQPGDRPEVVELVGLDRIEHGARRRRLGPRLA